MTHDPNTVVMTRTQTQDVAVMLCELYAYAHDDERMIDTLDELSELLGVDVSRNDVQDLIGFMQ
jgi:hypothetical protein